MLKVNRSPEPLADGIIEEAKGFSSTLLSDVMAGAGVMDYRIKPIAAGMTLAGTAFTIDLKGGSAMAILGAVALAGRGHVLVVGGKVDTTKALFGDLMVRTAGKSGVEGVVVDGLVRDIKELREAGLPLFAIGAVPAAIAKEGQGEINGSIACSGVAVSPGDLIVGDDDGVVVVPRDKIEVVFSAARAKMKAEMQRVEEIEQGLLLPEWLQNQIIRV